MAEITDAVCFPFLLRFLGAAKNALKIIMPKKPATPIIETDWNIHR